MRLAATLAAVLLIQASTPQVEDPAPGRLRWVPNPTRTTGGWVSDPAHHLHAATVARIDSVIFALERETSVEMAVVVIDSLDGLEPADAALLLHRRWGVGKRDRNNGLVFLWSPALRRTQVSVGYRLEGVLPDARVGRIQDQAVIPAFRRGDFDAGMIAGVEALAAAAREETDTSGGVRAYHPELTPEVAESPAGGDDDGDGVAWPWWALGGVGSLAGGAALVRRRRHRPPACPRGHGPMTRLDEQQDDQRLESGQRVEEQVGSVDYDVWTCARTRRRDSRPRRRRRAPAGRASVAARRAAAARGAATDAAPERERRGSRAQAPPAACSMGIASPTFTRSIATSVRKRFTFSSAKNSRRVSASYSAIDATVRTRTKSASPVT